MKKIVLLLMVTYIFICSQSYNESLSINYFKSYVYDFKELVTAPISFDNKDFSLIALYGGIFTTLYLSDNSITRKLSSVPNDFHLRDGIDIFNMYGDGRLSAPIVLGMYITGHITDDIRLKRTSLEGLKSVIIASTITTGLKYLFHRGRPYESSDQKEWHGPGISSGYRSFPSGHTTVAFALSTVIAKEYSDNKIIVISSYSAAGLTGLARIIDNKHWSSDVFIAALIGYYTGKLIYENNDPDYEISCVDNKVVFRYYL